MELSKTAIHNPTESVNDSVGNKPRVEDMADPANSGDTTQTWEEALRLAREAENEIADQLAAFNAKPEEHVERLIKDGA